MEPSGFAELLCGGNGSGIEIILLVCKDLAGDPDHCITIPRGGIVAEAGLERGGPCEVHAQLTVDEFEGGARELRGQCFKGCEGRAPGGVKVSAPVTEQILGDHLLLILVEIPFGSPSGDLAVKNPPTVVGCVGGFRGIDLPEGEAISLDIGAKFGCRAGHRQLVLAPVGHGWLGLDW